MLQLAQYDGKTPGKSIYVAIKGTIFDVSSKPEMYGPGTSYGIFAGKDGSYGEPFSTSLGVVGSHGLLTGKLSYR